MNSAPPDITALDEPTVRILPPAVTARIAAGEVVERPASVVKELVENALDAGARRVSVELGGGGLELVRVSDDGCGMSAQDLKLCVREHATSKIRTAEELPGLTTLGFRGEALPSIASVSHFSITTRRRRDEHAVKLELSGGEPADAETRTAAGAPGTVVEARELFYNLPARKKFLKGPAAEAAACTDTLLRLALTRPDTGFALFQDRREVFSVAPLSPPDGRAGVLPDVTPWLRRARELLGRSNTRDLLELDAIGAAAELPGDASAVTLPPRTLPLPEIPRGYRLYGLLSPPAVTRPNRGAIYLTVNGRPVKDRTLTSALLEAYRHLLPPKRYPLAVLYLELPGADVDANVHPTKTEVRFRVPGLVYALLHHAVRRACGADAGVAAAAAPNAPPPAPSAAPKPRVPHIPLGAPQPDFGQRRFDLWPRASDAPADHCGLRNSDCGLDGKTPAPEACAPQIRTPDNSPAERVEREQVSVPAGLTAPPVVEPDFPVPETAHEAAAAYARPAALPANPQSATRIPQSAPAAPAPLPPFRVLGQAGGSYIVLEDDTGVKLIDQHALHERVLFEIFLKKAHTPGRGEAQGLLVPQIFDLNPMQYAVFTQDTSASELLQALGFTVELFGDRAIAVRALPALFRSEAKAALVLDVLDALSETSDADPNLTRAKHKYSFCEKAAYMLACKGALKAGERLTIEQMTALVEEYRRRAGPNAFTCPHGRPVALELGWEELEKAVGRT